MDFMRFNSLKGHYTIAGSTALLDAVGKSIEDNRKLPEIFGDHAFLQYVITDGQENQSQKYNTYSISKVLATLPDNWTNAVLVPDTNGIKYAQRFGFNTGSIATWDTARGDAIEGVGKQFSQVVDNYMAMRASGVRGTKALFTLDSSGLTAVAPKKLVPIPQTAYKIFDVTKDAPIRPYVEAVLGSKYRIGSGYYQPTKKVVIQEYKNIYVQNVKDGKVYTGNALRQLLGLPSDSVEVNPGDHTDWNIFVQSTSTNRKLYTGTKILVEL